MTIKGSSEFNAGHIGDASQQFQVMNPELVICTMDSTSVSRDLPSLTVIVPLAPSLSKIPAIREPMCLSPLAEIVATFSISFFPLTGIAYSLRAATTMSTA